jgi:hypothetical protein
VPNIFLCFVLTVLLVLSGLRTNLGLSRILNHQIYIVICAFELQVELQLRFFQLQVRLQLNDTSKLLDFLCDSC